MPLKARDLMTRDVVTARPDQSILEAGELMLQRGMSGLPVVGPEGELVGIVTERDFLRPPGSPERPRWFQVLAGRYPRAETLNQWGERKVAEVMTPSPLRATEDTPLAQVLQTMEQHRIKRLPVVRGDRLVGIICRADLMRAAVQSVRESSALKRREDAQRSRLTEVERESWLHRTRM